MYSITDKLILRIMIIVGLVLTTGSGAALEAQGGWLLAAEGRTWNWRFAWQRRRGWAVSWQSALVRSLVLGALWELSGRIGWSGWQWLPWVVWLIPGEGRWMSKLKGGLWEVQRGVLLAYLGVWMMEAVSYLWSAVSLAPGLLSGVVVGGGGAPSGWQL